MLSKIKNIELIFREVGGVWRRVDSLKPNTPTLANILSQLQIVIDDDCQFCRIIRYGNKEKQIIEYRYYGGKVRINIKYV